MSKDVNKCTFIGRLGKDPDYKETATVKACNFSIACGDDYRDAKGVDVQQTNWVNIVAFGRLAEICSQYLIKGSQVYIEGKFVTRKWQDQNGVDRYSTEIIAKEMQMLGSKSDNQGASNASPQRQAPQQQAVNDSFDDDLPF